ncbi:amidohydrolase family protein [Ancylobacter mangrovi]|uniref:amidohydrolase family protein n=1 Tax=Ancylobacter mangrovi TaxID=2972472 RepID=UPI0021614D74|nr:amidohydrolase family protein [Ancylobacter mangrovi]MCS0504274.1 amidohydrolase family protein [Ancylobacter mangrovi]
MDHSIIDTATLGGNVNRYGPTSARKPSADPARLDTVTVDIHAHIGVPEAQAYVAPHLDVSGIAMVKYSNEETRAVNQRQDQDRAGTMVDIDDRIKVLDKLGISIQVVAPPPFQCYYAVDAAHGVVANRMVNDGIAAFVAKRPDRFAGLGTLAMQDPESAPAELERCVRELGLKGVELLTNVNGRELSAPEFEPVFAKAEELGALVMIHPNGFTGGERFTRFYFSNIIGNPLETTVALHYLIFDGVLERHPKLKLLAVHGGGYLPAYSGRIDHAWGARRDSNAGLPRPPSDYLRLVYFDSVVFTPHQLEYLVNTYGADHVVMGTDYPYDMADYDPVQHVLSVDSFDDETRARVAGGNAVGLLGL